MPATTLTEAFEQARSLDAPLGERLSVYARSLRDLNCGLAGETTFTNNLGSFTGPVIMFAGGHGFGSAMTDTAQLMSSATITMNSRADYGHVDYMFSTNHLQELEHPIFNWLLQVK